jgi:hypothetical protein
MRICSLLILLLLSFSAVSQKKTWDPAVLKKANTAKDVTYLTDEEKLVIFYMNLARLNPKLFGETYLKKYLDSTGDKNSYTKSLIKSLPTTKPMEALIPAKDLSAFAKDYATKSGKENKIGHGNFNQRTSKIDANYRGYIGENIDYGYNRAMDIVMRLLIDDTVPSLGHRKNILNPIYKFVGTSIKPHKRYDWNCVIDFGG